MTFTHRIDSIMSGAVVSQTAMKMYLQDRDIVPTAANLRDLVGNSADSLIYLCGIASIGDGLAGHFYWNAASSATDDNLLIIKPTVVSGTGRWQRTDALAQTLSTVLTSLANNTNGVGNDFMEVPRIGELGTMATLDAADARVPRFPVVYATDSTLVPNDFGRNIVATTGCTNIYLPAGADDGMFKGWWVKIVNISGSSLTVNCGLSAYVTDTVSNSKYDVLNSLIIDGSLATNHTINVASNTAKEFCKISTNSSPTRPISAWTYA